MVINLNHPIFVGQRQKLCTVEISNTTLSAQNEQIMFNPRGPR